MMLHTTMLYVRTICYTRKYDVLCPNLFYIRKCVRSEHMLHTNMRCVLSELMLHTKMCNIRTYVPHVYEIWSVPTVTYENVSVRTHEMFSVRIYITYENVYRTFSELGPRHSSTDDKWHLAIPLARSGQY